MNVFTYKVITTSGGRSFHIFTALLLKANLLRTSLDQTFRSSSRCPCSLEVSALWPLTLPTKHVFWQKWCPSALVMSSCGELKHNYSRRASTAHVGVELSGAIQMRGGIQPGSVKGPFLFHLRFWVSIDLNSHGRRITQNKASKHVRTLKSCYSYELTLKANAVARFLAQPKRAVSVTARRTMRQIAAQQA